MLYKAEFIKKSVSASSNCEQCKYFHVEDDDCSDCIMDKITDKLKQALEVKE